MHQHDVAGKPARLAEIVRRHYDLDAAERGGAHDPLDRLGGGWIEARGRLIEEQNLRRLGERAREREPLLLAAGKFSRRPVGERGEADLFEQIAGGLRALAARDASGGKRVAEIAAGAAAGAQPELG